MDTLSPVNILLVEDNPADQKLFGTSLKLQKVDSNLSVANCGEDAITFLEAAGSQPNQPIPDIILLDLNMPGIGGKEFLRRIKAVEKFKIIPVVVLTTSDSQTDIKECYQLQACGYIKKPVTLKGFLDIIKVLEDYWFKTCKLVTRMD